TLECDPEERPFAIEVREGDSWVHIGGCGLQKVDRQTRQAKLGLFIGAKAYWRQGLATDAMEALMGHGFNSLNLNRIHLRVYSFNEPGCISIASWALSRRAG
ncbi:MAG: GNAT family N-acetyltransferase, partial [Anaerolineales bacterium]